MLEHWGEQKATKSLGDVEMCKKKHENMLSIEAASKATRERETCLVCLENHNSFLIMGVDCGALHLGAGVSLVQQEGVGFVTDDTGA